MNGEHRLPIGVVGFLVAGCIAVGPAEGATKGENWPGWRGDGSGISAGGGLPVRWDAQTNVVWKVPLPGQGNSSPVVWGGRIFLTAATQEGAKRHVICRDLAAGRKTETYSKNGYASATPVTDGRRVFAFFDTPGLVALDAKDGSVLWTRDLGPFKTPWNLAASPVLCGDLVIQNCDHDGESFIAGIGRAKGEIRWKTPRAMPRQFATPLVIAVGGKKQVVINSATVVAYDPATGRPLWSCAGMKNMLTPSAVFDGSLVYVTSGRSGPSMAIDPRGSGDVSRTGVRMHLATGGPYVPSPLVYPILFLPGDNGAARFVDARGKVAGRKRLEGHFTSSPVAAGGRIYWTDEAGDTYVLDTGKATADPPRLKVIAVNRLGEKVLASPALAGGRIYIRTDKHLFCIAGEKKAPPAVTKETPPRPLAALKKLYEAHQQAEGKDVTVRLGIVEDLARHKGAETVAFLKRIARKDKHWDVSEEAVKVLGGFGKPAEAALIELLGAYDWQEYLKIISAEHLGRIGSAAAVPELLKLVGNNNPLIRAAALEALAKIADAHADLPAKAAPALTAALGDRDAPVQRAAVRGIGLLADKLGDRRAATVATLLDLAASRSRIVSAEALRALAGPFRIPPKVIDSDRILYGEQRKDPAVQTLAAGPISLKFQDGELRYLRVGGREIVRRVYFAVRDSRWDTVMPEFTKILVRKKPDGFQIDLAAVCRNDVAAYTWTGRIVGTPQGKITFRVNGRAEKDFQSWRVGLCVLYGAESLAGLGFEAIDEKGKAAAGLFPRPISREHLASNFRTLRYATRDGLKVSTALAKGRFSMEDQRNFGDSSYKAFSGIPYGYPNVKKGAAGSQTLRLEVSGAGPAQKRPPLVVHIGRPVPGAKMPKLLPATASAKGKGFLGQPRDTAALVAAERIVMSYNPASHLPDDDTFMENLSAIADQVQTLRLRAPKAKFRIDPIGFDSPYPRPGPDPRNKGLFAAAWCTAAVKHLALAGAEEAAFKVGPGYAAFAQELLGQHAGRAVLDTGVGPHEPIAALAIAAKSGRVLVLMNKTGHEQTVAVKGLGPKVRLRRLNAATSLKSGPGAARALAVADGSLELPLGPFEVCFLTEGK